ncbi:hypothetical protein Tco_0999995 [Tanacetum coccineum]
MARRCDYFVENTKDDSCGRVNVKVVTKDNDDEVEVVCLPSTVSTAEVPLLNVTPSPILGSAQLESIAYGLVDKSPGLTHVDVSCEGYLEHDAETNSMDIANSMPFASLIRVNIPFSVLTNDVTMSGADVAILIGSS